MRKMMAWRSGYASTRVSLPARSHEDGGRWARNAIMGGHGGASCGLWPVVCGLWSAKGGRGGEAEAGPRFQKHLHRTARTMRPKMNLLLMVRASRRLESSQAMTGDAVCAVLVATGRGVGGRAIGRGAQDGGKWRRNDDTWWCKGATAWLERDGCWGEARTMSDGEAVVEMALLTDERGRGGREGGGRPKLGTVIGRRAG